jgi:hypothetical protein
MTYVFSKVILTEIHYRCQFSLNFSSQNTKSIKIPNLIFDFFSLEFLSNFSRISREIIFLFEKFLKKNIYEKWTQSKQRSVCNESVQFFTPSKILADNSHLSLISVLDLLVKVVSVTCLRQELWTN